MLPKESKKNIARIKEEKAWLDALIQYPNPKQTWRKLMKSTRKDMEKTGNAYWELIPSVSNPKRYTCINKMNAGSVFITKPEKKLGRKTLKYIDDSFNVRRKTFTVRFRMYVNQVGRKMRFFKEFGDPRIIDRRNGKVVAQSPEQWEKARQRNKKEPSEKVLG